MSKPKYLIDVGENGDDNHHAWLKHNKEIERIYSIMSGGGFGEEGSASGGTGGSSPIGKDMGILRDELDRLDAQLKDILNRISGIIDDDKKDREALNNLAAEMADKLKELREEDATRLSERSKELEDSVSKSLQDMNDTMTAMDQKREELAGDAKSLQSKLEDLTETATGIQKSQDVLAITVNNNKEDISQVTQKADEITTTVASNKTAQDATNTDLKAQISTVSQKADEVDTIVADLNKDPSQSPYSSISKLKQRADSIESSVSSAEKEISDVKQTADGISTVVADLNKDPSESPYGSISKLQQRADSITTTVENNLAYTDKQISTVSQKANEVDTVVAELGKSPDEVTYKSIADLNVKADTIESTITANKTDLEKQISDVKQTADGITTVVAELNNTQTNNKYGAISKLQQRADSIESSVISVRSEISDVKQTANGITAVVANLNTEDPSKSPYKSITALQQTTDNIKTQVGSYQTDTDGKISSLHSEMSQSDSTIKASITAVEDNLNATDPSKSPYKSITALQAGIDGISSTVAKNRADMETADNEIKADVSSIDQKANSISTTVAGITTNLNDTDLANSPYKAISSIYQSMEDIKSTVTQNRNDELSQISTISQKANEVDTIVAELNKTPDSCTYTAISSMNQTVGEISSTVAANKQDVDGKLTTMQSNIDQLNDKIALSIKKGDDIVSAINLSPDGVHIEGKFVKIDGTTIINNKVISGDNLKDQTITVDKLKVNELSAITATIGHFRSAETGARVEIQDSLIEVYDENNTLRVRLGVW